MSRSKERIKAPVGGRKWKRRKGKKDRFKNTHYSEKTGHRKRSDHHPGNTGKRHR